VIEEWELWACAHELVRRHGVDAAIRAAMRADALLEAGDLAGARTFQLIVHKVNALQRRSATLQ
jgi:hypothetical protein